MEAKNAQKKLHIKYKNYNTVTILYVLGIVCFLSYCVKKAKLFI
jgi:hypothetical protein